MAYLLLARDHVFGCVVMAEGNDDGIISLRSALYWLRGGREEEEEEDSMHSYPGDNTAREVRGIKICIDHAHIVA